MTYILRNSTTWLIAILLGIATYAGMLANQYSIERDLAQERVERTLERNVELKARQEWMQGQMDRLHRVIRVRSEQMAEDKDHIDASREAAQALEREDEDIAEWAGRDVDGSIVDWLRKLREAGAIAADSAGSDHPGLPDSGAASTHQGDKASAGHAEPDS